MRKMILLKRRILAPWLLSAVVMMVISFAWHGLALTDISDLRMDRRLYFGLSTLAYLIIALAITRMVQFLIMREWISLKGPFPVKAMFVGGATGIVVYLAILAMGLSFASRGMQHAVVDFAWQVVEQSVGGLMVGLGIIYDLHRNFMEAERAR